MALHDCNALANYGGTWVPVIQRGQDFMDSSWNPLSEPDEWVRASYNDILKHEREQQSVLSGV